MSLCDTGSREGGRDRAAERAFPSAVPCAVERFGPVPGGSARAICIARRERGLDPSATSSPTGRYRGLFQHDRDLWPARYDRKEC